MQYLQRIYQGILERLAGADSAASDPADPLVAAHPA